MAIIMPLYRVVLVFWLLSSNGYCQGLFDIDGLRDQAKSMFYHGWDSYMQFGFPEDEVRPISCIPNTRNHTDPSDLSKNDALGGYALTMLDSLDMFAIMNETEQFHHYVDLVERYVDFNVSSTVHVFETTIRAMGGLLSAHLYASLPRLGQAKPGYDGKLLDLAHSLGERLLPAFASQKSGFPHPRVNLAYGVVKIGNEYITETCAACSASLLLEFGMLSRLTGDTRFENLARKAFFELWARRSELDLAPMSIDSLTGNVLSPITGIGASIDSMYEYAVKYYILFGGDQFYSIFERMFESLQTYSFNGWLYDNINFETGAIVTTWIDALAAFFPGIQVLAGKVEEAIQTHLTYYKLWNAYGGIPERWNHIRAKKDTVKIIPNSQGKVRSKFIPNSQGKVRSKFTPKNKLDPIDLEWYPLRPEFIESNYYIYRATGDPFYLQIGRKVLGDLEKYKTDCGYSGIQDVRTGSKSDRMETFFLSETAKYLYLLFSPDHPLNREYSNSVFSTEAHPLWYDSYVLEHASVSKFSNVRNAVVARSVASPFRNVDRKHNEEAKAVNSDMHSSLVSKLKSAWSSRLSGGKTQKPKVGVQTSGNNTKTPFRAPQCRAWRPLHGMSSVVASWDHFYELDREHDFSSPQWLLDLHNNSRIPMELDMDFYSTYVRPGSTCRELEADRFIDISFGIPEGRERSQLLVDQTEIFATNLNGVELRVAQLKDNGRDIFKLMAVEGISVGDREVSVQELLLDTPEFAILDILGDGTLTIQGSPVINVHVH